MSLYSTKMALLVFHIQINTLAHRNAGDAGISADLTGHSQSGETNENNGKQAISIVTRLAVWILTLLELTTTLFQPDNLGLVIAI